MHIFSIHIDAKRLSTSRRKTLVYEARVNPLGQWSCLQTDALKRLMELAQFIGNGVRCTIFDVEWRSCHLTPQLAT